MNHPKLLATLLLFLCYTGAFAQQNFKKVGTWLQDNADDMGGRVILMVYHDGKVAYSHSAKKMSFKQKATTKFIARRQGTEADLDEYTPTTKIPIASCSKWLSAALVMTFIDESKLKLTDTVGKYLPVLSAAGKGKITISQCLSHMTAIKAPPLKENLEEMRSAANMEEAMADVAKMPMEGEPGKIFHYSNTGLQIAGAVIEKISGKNFETLFAERIARPCGMKDTDFGHKKAALPAGGAMATPEDYLSFLVMIMNKGTFNGKRVLSENSIAEMQINRVTPEVKVTYSPVEAASFGYAYGEWVMGPGTVTSPGLFGSFPWVDNQRKYAAFMMTFYVKNTGRNERYKALKGLVDEAVGN